MANENPGAIPPKVSPITPVQPGVPRPITVHLKPVAKPAAPVEVGSAVNPRQTSRIPLPDSVANASASPISPISPVVPHSGITPTVRLRTVTVPRLHPAGAPLAATGVPVAAAPVQPVVAPIPAAAPAAAAPLRPFPPLQPQRPPTPGSNPLPAGPKPPSPAQVQASKSKTSRISLDSAIGVAPVGDEPKTIRLKRPADLTPSAVKPAAAVPHPIFTETTQLHQTAPIPEAHPSIPAVSEASVTQKKTLKIKRPSSSGPAAVPEGEEPAAAEGGSTDADFANLKPIDEMEGEGKKSSSVFVTISVVVGAIAAVILVLLTLCLGAQAMGPDAGKNSLASIPGPELPWAGK